jgi:hypothetical protein
VSTLTDPDAICSRIVAELPSLGDEVAKELDAIEEHLARFHAASQRYNGFARDSLRALENRGRECPRVALSRWHPARVDGLTVRTTRPDAQLARIVAPIMEALRAPGYIGADLRTLGESASDEMATSQEDL